MKETSIKCIHAHCIGLPWPSYKVGLVSIDFFAEDCALVPLTDFNLVTIPPNSCVPCTKSVTYCPASSPKCLVTTLENLPLLKGNVKLNMLNFFVDIHQLKVFAAIEWVEGKFPFPRGKPPYPAQSGVHGNPTLINNMETLANVSHIVRCGPEWYRAKAYNGPWVLMEPSRGPRAVVYVPRDYRAVYGRQPQIPYGQWKKEHARWDRENKKSHKKWKKEREKEWKEEQKPDKHGKNGKPGKGHGG